MRCNVEKIFPAPINSKQLVTENGRITTEPIRKYGRVGQFNVYKGYNDSFRTVWGWDGNLTALNIVC